MKAASAVARAPCHGLVAGGAVGLVVLHDVAENTTPSSATSSWHLGLVLLGVAARLARTADSMMVLPVHRLNACNCAAAMASSSLSAPSTGATTSQRADVPDERLVAESIPGEAGDRRSFWKTCVLLLA